MILENIFNIVCSNLDNRRCKISFHTFCGVKKYTCVRSTLKR